MKMTLNEVWKDIPNYEGIYQISNYGNVKSLKRNTYNQYGKKDKILKPILQNDDYYAVNLSYKNKVKRLRINRLVADAFIPNPNNYNCVNHIDGNKHNNNVNNLEWCTFKENTQHALKNGLIKRKKVICYDLKNNVIKHFNSVKDASDNLKINYNTIYNYIRSKRIYNNMLLDYVGGNYD